MIAKGENGTVRELIIPESVIRIGTGAIEGIHVTERISFPAGLRAIGTEIWESAVSWCELPDVVLPDGVEELTSFAFGKCRMRSLRLPAGLRLTGGRHFKSAQADVLYLPTALRSVQEATDAEMDALDDDLFEYWHNLDAAFGNNFEVGRIEYYG